MKIDKEFSDLLETTLNKLYPKGNCGKERSKALVFFVEAVVLNSQMRELQKKRIKKEIGKQFRDWIYGDSREDIEEAIERITGVKC